MPFPYDTQTYYEFNKAIAINHVELQHKEDRALNHVAFGEIYLSSDPFEQIDISSFMADLKSKIKYPLMLAIGTDWDGRGGNLQNSNVINGAFLILDKPDSKINDRDDRRRECYVRTERIAQEISAYLIAYFELNCGLGNLETFPSGEKIGRVAPDNLYGTMVKYSYTSRYSNFVFKQDRFGDLEVTDDLASIPVDC